MAVISRAVFRYLVVLIYPDVVTAFSATEHRSFKEPRAPMPQIDLKMLYCLIQNTLTHFKMFDSSLIYPYLYILRSIA